jgi:hypothetical protein
LQVDLHVRALAPVTCDSKEMNNASGNTANALPHSFGIVKTRQATGDHLL